MVTRLWEWSVVQAESMAETGIVTGLLAAPLLGVVTKEDADSAVVIDMARDILGNPYADDRRRATADSTAGRATRSRPTADGDQSTAVPEGGRRLVPSRQRGARARADRTRTHRVPIGQGPDRTPGDRHHGRASL